MVGGLESMDWAWGWTAVGAIATCILAGGVFFAIWQINQAKRSTNAQIAIGLFQELRNQTTIERIRSIYDLKNNSQDYKKDIDYVIDRFDTLGDLVVKGIVDKKLAIETYGGVSALRCWYKLKHYIIAERNNRGYYGDYYETFVRLSLNHFKKEHIQVKFYMKDEKNTKINLVTELQKDELRPRSFKEIKRARKTYKDK